ncbi:hypothetical protein Tco_0903554, partial [Tanacetum coccineum]
MGLGLYDMPTWLIKCTSGRWERVRALMGRDMEGMGVARIPWEA